MSNVEMRISMEGLKTVKASVPADLFSNFTKKHNEAGVMSITQDRGNYVVLLKYAAKASIDNVGIYQDSYISEYLKAWKISSDVEACIDELRIGERPNARESLYFLAVSGMTERPKPIKFDPA